MVIISVRKATTGKAEPRLAHKRLKGRHGAGYRRHEIRYTPLSPCLLRLRWRTAMQGRTATPAKGFYKCLHIFIGALRTFAVVFIGAVGAQIFMALGTPLHAPFLPFSSAYAALHSGHANQLRSVHDLLYFVLVSMCLYIKKAYME